jgi:hypothetical protein
MTAFVRVLAIVAVSVSMAAWAQDAGPSDLPQGGASASNTKLEPKLQPGMLLVKGAWWSASDSTTPLPETGTIDNRAYSNPYFGFSYRLPADWTLKSTGPPPSDSGSYVLTLLKPADTYKGPGRGSILVTAQDMFFTPVPIASALELVEYAKAHLSAGSKLDQEPTQTSIAGRSFTSFAYSAPVPDLHWHVLATEMRCHTVEFIFMNRDPKTLESLVQEMNKLDLAPAKDAPVCIKDYASGDNVVERVNPLLTEHRFNPVPVRIIIDKEGKIKHIHFLSAFPDQAKAISDALAHWKFKPYLRDGKPVEVETGILFGHEQRLTKPAVRTVTAPNSVAVANQR